MDLRGNEQIKRVASGTEAFLSPLTHVLGVFVPTEHFASLYGRHRHIAELVVRFMEAA